MRVPGADTDGDGDEREERSGGQAEPGDQQVISVIHVFLSFTLSTSIVSSFRRAQNQQGNSPFPPPPPPKVTNKNRCLEMNNPSGPVDW